MSYRRLGSYRLNGAFSIRPLTWNREALAHSTCARGSHPRVKNVPDPYRVGHEVCLRNNDKCPRKISMTVPRPEVDIPLCVDLDGTLVRTDTLIESLFAIFRYHPWHLFVIPLWLFRGLPYAKQKIQSLHQINVALLPYRQDVLEIIKREKSRGRRTVLVTASNQELADKI